MKSEKRLNKKSGFVLDNVGLKRENICFKNENVGLQSEKKKIKTRPVRVVACRQQQCLVPSQSHLDKECQLTTSFRILGEIVLGRQLLCRLSYSIMTIIMTIISMGSYNLALRKTFSPFP